jgi:hypothetical protein
MIMRKNTLLIAVAAAALAAGSGTAFAQGMPQAGHKADSPAVQSNPASKNAPAEKIQGAEHNKGSADRMGEAKGSKPETTGQGASERGQKMGQDLDKTRKSTTGQAPIEPKSGQANERRDNKMGQDQKKMGQDQKTLNNKSTTGQAPSQQTTPKPDRAGEQNRTNTGQMNERGGATQNENRSGANENRTGTSTSTNSSTSTSSNVSLTTEQRTKIHSIIVADRSAPRVAHVDFDVHVGTVVPRGKVKFVPLPTTIVEIEPSWRGFEYFLVGDELVVVDPATLRIVAVLPA